MFDFKKLLEDISTYAILIPILTGLIVYRSSSKEIKFLLFFLIWGFIVDSPRDYILNQRFNIWAYNIYAFTETMFMLWFLEKCSNKWLSDIIKVLFIIMFLLWFAYYFVFVFQIFELNYNDLFDSISAIIISSISAVCLLEMTKRSERITILPAFWFLSGIFFYFFCANFIFGFLQTDFVKQIWFIHNIINILTYFIFTKAFLVVGKLKSKQSQNLLSQR